MAQLANDRAFEAVLQNTGQSIEKFVDEFFSFLARRSDFFVESPPDGGRIGFPPGVAAKLIISKFKKWEEFSKLNPKDNLPPSQLIMRPDQIPVSKEEEETCSSKPQPVSTKPLQGSKPQPYSQPVSAKLPSTSQPVSSKPQSASPVESPKIPSSPAPQASKDPESTSSLSDSYNGRKTDTYSWSQSIKEVDVYLTVDKSVKTKRQVKVDIQMNKIRVDITDASNQVTTTDWVLPHSIVKDESYWSLYPGESIFLSLQKAREMWWDHMFQGEEPIDRTQIDATRPLEDLPDQEQAKIQELVWNETQKLQGNKTSDELKLEEIMKNAWDAEGSPFKGQPFDMSKIKLANNTINGD